MYNIKRRVDYMQTHNKYIIMTLSIVTTSMCQIGHSSLWTSLYTTVYWFGIYICRRVGKLMQIMNTHKYQTKLLHVYTYRICISVKIKAEYMQYSTKFLIILADSVLVLWLCQLQQKTTPFLRLCRFLWSLWVDLSHQIIEDLEKKLAVSSIHVDHKLYMYMCTSETLIFALADVSMNALQDRSKRDVQCTCICYRRTYTCV